MKGKNLKIKIFVSLFLTLNIILIIVGNVLIAQNKKRLRDDAYQTLTSDIMVEYMSDDEFETYDELLKGMDDEDEHPQIPETISNAYFSSNIQWTSVMDILAMFGSSGISNNIIESSKSIGMILLLDKGIQDETETTALLSDLTGKEITKDSPLYREMNLLLSDQGLEGGLEEGLLNIIDAIGSEYFGKFEWAGIWAIGKPILTNVFNRIIILSPLDVFRYDLSYEFDESSDISDPMPYEFSKGLSSGSYTGDDNHKGISNWNNKEISDFSTTIGFNTDLWDRNNKTLNYELWKPLNISDDNTKFLWYRYMKKISQEYYGKEPQDKVKYRSWEIKTKGGLGKKEYYFQPEQHTYLSGERDKAYYVDSMYEAFLYDIYNNLNYASYFDKALTLDNKDYYDLNEYVVDNGLKPEGKYTYNPELNIEVNPILWTKGQGEVAFDYFVAIAEMYNPFLRGDTIDSFIWDITGRMTKGVNLWDLEKPNNV